MKEHFTKLIYFVKRFSREIIIALVLAIITAVAIEIVKEKTKEKTIKNNLKAIALLLSRGAEKDMVIQGSGVFIDSGGTLVTSYHVIREADLKTLKAKLPTGAYYLLRSVINTDEKSDIAIIKFDAIETPCVELGNSDEIHPGEEITVMGAPSSIESTVSTGVISNPERKLNDLQFIQFTAPISPGSSGGGLFNRSGKIIGIVAATLKPSQTQNLNFAVPINNVRNMLQNKEKAIPVGSREHFYSEGILAQNRKQYDKAIEYFKKAISVDENYVNAYIDLGMVYDEMGSFDEELKVLKKAVILDPKYSDGFYYLAMAYENEGLYDLAISAYEKVIEIKPQDKDTLYQLGILYIVEDKRDKAEKLVPRLAKLNTGLSDELKQLLKRVK